MKGSITIDDREWSYDQFPDLIQALSSSGLDWKISAGEFLKDWISDDDHVMVHTSGSTGKRKSIRLPKSLMRRSAEITARHFDLPAGSKALMCLGSGYIAGMMMVVRTLVNDWNLTIVEPGSNPLEDERESFDFCAMVPLQVQNSLENSPDKLAQIGKLIIGGAAVNSELISRLTQAGVHSFATYGMTETATHIAIRKLSPKTEDHFTTLPEYKIQLDARQCININAEHLDSAVQTNDAAQLTSNGFRLLGRIDNVINTGGVKVFPEEIEAKIAAILQNQAYYVTSSEDEKLGEKVTLVVEGNEVLERDILKECSTRVDAHQRPRVILFESTFTRTQTGKIIRNKF